jgi:hypothetical protein
MTFLRRHGLVLLYLTLVVACVLFAPEKPQRFIYTEF